MTPDGVSAVSARRSIAGLHPYIKWPRPGKTSRAAGVSPWDVTDICDTYQWPTPADAPGGGGIAIVELGGGWLPADMKKFFAAVGANSSPSITDVSVDGTKNSPGVDTDSDGEVALDIQLAGAAYFKATGRAATIRVYWARDIAAAVNAAASDRCDVCSISWGADEANWTGNTGTEMETAAANATAAGMIVFAASGDNDSSDGGSNAANVDLPASCPHVVACGGTRLTHFSPPRTANSETVWNDNPGKSNGEGTGGGYSTLFPVPNWQIGVPSNAPGRMVPDVAANADPDTGYTIVVGGESQVVGGTSAVAPLYAGLFAAFGTKLGFVSPELWSHQACFNDVTIGDNGAYRAGTGPDPCTGLGSPIGTRLADLLASDGPV
jgi:kumamolisin